MARASFASRPALAGLVAALALFSRTAAARPSRHDDDSDFLGTALSVGWQVGLAWAASFLGLLVIGWMLSHAALRAADTAPEGATGHPRGAEKAVRQVYRAVLWLCCGFYYLSLPLLLVVVVAAG